MNAKRVISRLKSLGTEQTRKTYVRHGVEDAFGVLYSDFYKLAKQAAVAKKKAAKKVPAKNKAGGNTAKKAPARTRRKAAAAK